MDYFVDLFYMLIQSLNDIWSFVISLWNVFQEMVHYISLYALSTYLDAKILMVEIAYDVANSVLANYEVYTLISESFNKLPANVSYSAHALGVVDAIRIVVDAAATAFVLRVMGW